MARMRVRDWGSLRALTSRHDDARPSNQLTNHRLDGPACSASQAFACTALLSGQLDTVRTRSTKLLFNFVGVG